MNEYHEYVIYQHTYNTVKTVKSRTVSTGQKGSKSTYNCPKMSIAGRGLKVKVTVKVKFSKDDNAVGLTSIPVVVPHRGRGTGPSKSWLGPQIYLHSCHTVVD